MNAKQRRRDRKAWKYIVEFDDHVVWDQYHEMWTWTVEQFGQSSPWWREAHGHTGTRWEFQKEKDALFFKLRWGGN